MTSVEIEENEPRRAGRFIRQEDVVHTQPNKAATTKLSEDAPAKVREPSTVPAVGRHLPYEQSLNLGAIGNCTIAALIDPSARMVWCCYPRVDSDTIFDDLINRSDGKVMARLLSNFSTKYNANKPIDEIPQFSALA